MAGRSDFQGPGRTRHVQAQNITQRIAHLITVDEMPRSASSTASGCVWWPGTQLHTRHEHTRQQAGVEGDHMKACSMRKIGEGFQLKSVL